ncbi:MAG: dienelactone hydrolase family protein [Candidatus Hydrogenedentes bacterium]|nr:dienelactone hydrolase family protein [Candidatus Hydrogenedentota bacterium]
MKRVARILLLLLVLLALASGVGAIAKYRADQSYYDGYDAALALDPIVRETAQRDEYTRIDFTYQSTPDSRVPSLLALPKDTTKPYPCIIFLHGIGQSKSFLDEIAGYYTKAGFAITSFDQYMRGERRIASKDPVSQLLGLRKRTSLNVIDTRRLVDYLQTRDDIAKDRIYLVGASFGAITGCTAVAFEPRIPAAVMTYGGGDLDLLLDSEAARKELGRFRAPLTSLVAYMTSPSDPVKYVGKIAPRPVLFQNGEHDQLIPFAAAKALVEAAGEPKEFTVYDSDHVGLDENQTIQVLKDSISWLQKQDERIVSAANSATTPDGPQTVVAPVSSSSATSSPAPLAAAS